MGEKIESAVACKPEDPPVVVNIAVASIAESKFNPRKTFDEKKLAELAESIRALGIQMPLIVRPAFQAVKEDHGQDARATYYELVCGARRLRAAVLAGVVAVPCITKDLTEAQALEIRITENLQREDLSICEEAEGFDALMKISKLTVQEIAMVIGKSIRYVYQRLQVHESLIPEAREACERGWVTGSHLVLLAALSAKAQTAALLACLAGDSGFGGSAIDDEQELAGVLKDEAPEQVASVRALQMWIEENIHTPLAGAPWDKKAVMPDCKRSCVECTQRSDWEFGSMAIAKKAQCLNPECYQANLATCIMRRLGAAADAGAPLLQLSSSYDKYGACGEAAVKKHYILHSKWNEAKGGDEGAAGIIMDGHEAGRQLQVTIKSETGRRGDGETGSNGEPLSAGSGATAQAEPVTTLAERRVKLATRRNAWICDQLREKILPKTEVAAVCDLHLEPAVVIPMLAAAFGTIGNTADIYSRGDPIKVYDKLVGSEPTATVAALWKSVRPVLEKRLTYFTREQVPLDDMKLVFRLIGAKWEELQVQADDAIPEPKSWAKEEKDAETGRRGDAETGRRGDAETGRRGDAETGRRGDAETGRRGDAETRRRGENGNEKHPGAGN
jgi:ParB/RepB/Spo0J family partition protein